MPHYESQLFHLGGVPVGPGNGIPLSVGKCSNGERVHYYWVDGTWGSDGYTGLSPSKPKATIAAAIALMNANISWSVTRWSSLDVLVIAPGVYAENLTALPYGATVIGLGDSFDINGINGVTIKPASGAPVDCTSVINCHIHNICFESSDTTVCFQADNFNRNVVSHCMFTGLAGSSPTTVKGLEIVKDMTGSRITDCVFQVVRNGIYIVTDNANSKQASGNIIEHCYIRGCDQTGIYFDANCVPSYTQINHCVIGDGGTTLALGLDDNTGVVNVSWTVFTATACDPASGDGDSKYNGCYLNGSLIS
jgi:hypothetical protein